MKTFQRKPKEKRHLKKSQNLETAFYTFTGVKHPSALMLSPSVRLTLVAQIATRSESSHSPLQGTPSQLRRVVARWWWARRRGRGQVTARGGLHNGRKILFLLHTARCHFRAIDSTCNKDSEYSATLPCNRQRSHLP